MLALHQHIRTLVYSLPASVVGLIVQSVICEVVVVLQWEIVVIESLVIGQYGCVESTIIRHTCLHFY